MRAGLNIAAIFIAVGLGAVTVALVYDPGVLIPRPPYIDWIFASLSLAALAMLFVLALEEELWDSDDTDGSSDLTIHWRAVGLAYLTSVLASATFIGASAFVDYLDRLVA